MSSDHSHKGLYMHLAAWRCQTNWHNAFWSWFVTTEYMVCLRPKCNCQREFWPVFVLFCSFFWMCAALPLNGSFNRTTCAPCRILILILTSQTKQVEWSAFFKVPQAKKDSDLAFCGHSGMHTWYEATCKDIASHESINIGCQLRPITVKKALKCIWRLATPDQLPQPLLVLFWNQGTPLWFSDVRQSKPKMQFVISVCFDLWNLYNVCCITHERLIWAHKTCTLLGCRYDFHGSNSTIRVVSIG